LALADAEGVTETVFLIAGFEAVTDFLAADLATGFAAGLTAFFNGALLDFLAAATVLLLDAGVLAAPDFADPLADFFWAFIGFRPRA